MKPRDVLALTIREKRVAAEQVLLNRAVRANKNWMDRIITKVVMTQIPTVTPDVGRSKTLDSTPREPRNTAHPTTQDPPRPGTHR